MLDCDWSSDVCSSDLGALKTAGADVTYVEIDDLAHSYPREMNGPVLSWLGVP
jgi:phospholipase/carboxylesterase